MNILTLWRRRASSPRNKPDSAGANIHSAGPVVAVLGMGPAVALGWAPAPVCDRDAEKWVWVCLKTMSDLDVGGFALAAGRGALASSSGSRVEGSPLPRARASSPRGAGPGSYSRRLVPLGLLPHGPKVADALSR